MSLRSWLLSLPGIPDSWAKDARKDELANALKKLGLDVGIFLGNGIDADLEVRSTKDQTARIKFADREITVETCARFYNELKRYANQYGYQAFVAILWVRNGFVPLEVRYEFGPRGSKGRISFCKKKTISAAADYIKTEIDRLQEKGAL